MILTERLQKAAIYRLYQGTPLADVQPERFDPPWKEIYLLLERRLRTSDVADDDPLDWAVNACGIVPATYADYWDRVDQIAYEIKTAERQYKPRTLADVAATYPPVRWLWPGWLPLGMLSLLAGQPATGKSHWALDLARIIQRAAPWPDGAPYEPRSSKNVVWIEGEGIAQEIEERAGAMGLDTRSIYMTSAPSGEILNLMDRAWQNEVVDMVATTHPPLIIVDSLSTISDKGQDRSEQVTPLLLWLVGLARWSDASVLLVHHLRKREQGGQRSLPLRVTMDDIRGSGQIAAQSRSIVGMSHTTSEPDQPRLLEVLKKTVSRGKHPKPLGIAAVRTPDGELISGFSYDAAPKMEGTPAREECADWLLDLLSDGPMRLRDILSRAKEEGYSDSMVWRARKSLGVEIADTHGKQHPQNQWTLADDDESASNDDA